MYYLLLFLTTIPLFLVEEDILKIGNNKNKSVRWVYVFSATVLILMALLRDNTLGNDVRNYMSIYFANPNTHEIGFSVLVDIVRFFIRDFQVFISVNSLLALIPIFISFYVISSKKWLSLLMFQSLYYYASSFSLLRQFLAIGWVMLATICIKKYLDYHKQWNDKKSISVIVLSIILILIASLFHYSAIAMLILPTILIIDHRYHLIVIYALSGLFMFFFRNQITEFLITTFFEYKELYIGNEPEIGIFPILQFGGILVNQFIYRIKSKELHFLEYEKEYLFVTNLAILWLITIFVFSWFPNLARVTMYITIIMCAFLPNFVQYKKSFYIFIFVALLGYYSFSLNYRDYQGIYPFRWMRGLFK